MLTVSLILLAGFVYGGYYLGQVLQNENPVQVKHLTSSEILLDEIVKTSLADSVSDSDNDGLKNWEENLRKTDPKNPDSDGDGTTDGDEVAAGRDPLKTNTAKKGQTPNDILEVRINNNSSTTEPILTETEKLARELFSTYLSLNKGDKTLTIEEQASMIDNVLNKAKNNVKLDYKTYTTKDFSSISGQITKSIIDKYKQDLRKALDYAHTKSGNGTTSELTILQSALDDENENALNDLDPIIKEYSLLTKELLKIKVPSVAVKDHLDFVNNVSFVGQAISYMKTKYNDPVVILAVLNDYKTHVALMWSALNKL